MFPTPIEKTSKTNRFIYYSSVILVLLLWLVPLMIRTLAAFKTADQLNAGGRGFVLPEPFTLYAFKTKSFPPKVIPSSTPSSRIL